MSDVAQVWQEALPVIRRGVTGVGVWAALNACKPLTVEEGAFVVGLASQDAELSGHLRLPQTKKLIEQEMSGRLGQPVVLRVIEGATPDAWERAKRRDAEARRLQEQAHQRAVAEISSRTNWESIYEQLGRKFASTANKSLPQNRAKFFEESLEIVADARKNQQSRDELNERNFARCIERLSQYSEVPSTIVATLVLKRAGEL
ncbi:MAG TPA: hypothetical protein VEX38_00705 [Fimbriimonadaceae bacterium]|nr:hypothetical protein [Fimbriimonadaceae bacterium]